MKNEEIRSLSVKELQDKIGEEKNSYQKLKFAHAVSPVENPMQIRQQRKFIARLETELSSKLKAQ